MFSSSLSLSTAAVRSVQFRRYLYWQARLFIMAQDREWWSRQLHISRDGSFRLSNKSTQALLCILSCKQQVLSSLLSYRVACCLSSSAPVYYITHHRLSQIGWKLFWSHLFRKFNENIFEIKSCSTPRLGLIYYAWKIEALNGQWFHILKNKQK